MRDLLIASVLGLALAGPALAEGLDVQVAGEANGTFHIELFDKVAPKNVERLVTLAKEGQYDGVAFHRVIEGFMAQTGDVQYGKKGQNAAMVGRGGSNLPDLPAEFSKLPFKRGTVGMARSQNPNSANSQFFIMFEPGDFLNGQYTVVGEVTSGMDVVDKIKKGMGQNGSVTGEPDRMVKVTVTDK